MRPTLFCSVLLSCLFAITAGPAMSQLPEKVAKNDAKPSDPAGANTNVSLPLTKPVDLTRVGVQQAQTLPLSLQEAIRRSLENNNDIEVSRGDVRFQQTQVGALLGVYDIVFTATPTFSRSSTTGSVATNDFRANANIGQFIRQGGGNYQLFFNNARTENAFTQAQLSSGSVSGGNSAIFTSSLGVAYNQPLLRNFRIDNRRYQIAIAKKRLLQTDADFQLRATNTVTDVHRIAFQ